MPARRFHEDSTALMHLTLLTGNQVCTQVASGRVAAPMAVLSARLARAGPAGARSGPGRAAAAVVASCSPSSWSRAPRTPPATPLVPGAPGRPDRARRHPADGRDDWNAVGCTDAFDEAWVRAQADALVATGLRDEGYRYVDLDDCWAAPRARHRGPTGARPGPFPARHRRPRRLRARARPAAGHLHQRRHPDLRRARLPRLARPRDRRRGVLRRVGGRLRQGGRLLHRRHRRDRPLHDDGPRPARDRAPDGPRGL